VLQCNNTAILYIRLIKRDPLLLALLPRPSRCPILAPMSEDDDLARRFFALWAEYLAALVADPKMNEPLHRWLAIAAGSLNDAGPSDASACAPPRSSSGPAPRAAPAARASGERDAAMAELARRVEELDERTAALERPSKSGRRPVVGARRRNRPARS
jgi:hypothetical protein